MSIYPLWYYTNVLAMVLRNVLVVVLHNVLAVVLRNVLAIVLHNSTGCYTIVQDTERKQINIYICKHSGNALASVQK